MRTSLLALLAAGTLTGCTCDAPARPPAPSTATPAAPAAAVRSPRIAPSLDREPARAAEAPPQPHADALPAPHLPPAAQDWQDRAIASGAGPDGPAPEQKLAAVSRQIDRLQTTIDRAERELATTPAGPEHDKLTMMIGAAKHHVEQLTAQRDQLQPARPTADDLHAPHAGRP